MAGGATALLQDFIGTDVRTRKRCDELLEALNADLPQRFAGNAYLIEVSAVAVHLETLNEPWHAASVTPAELREALQALVLDARA
jgi:hypothetical protein